MKNIIMSFLISLCFFGCKEVEKVEISIPTAQCGMCANNIQNALMGVKGVKKVNVKLDNSIATVIAEKEGLDILTFETAISNVGYKANDKTANLETYQNLPACCKLPEDR